MKDTTARYICEELEKARKKFPTWPTDPVHAAAVVAEEAGELVQAALQFCYEGGEYKNLAEEAVQVAAMAVRFLESISEYEVIQSTQTFDN